MRYHIALANVGTNIHSVQVDVQITLRGVQGVVKMATTQIHIAQGLMTTRSLVGAETPRIVLGVARNRDLRNVETRNLLVLVIATMQVLAAQEAQHPVVNTVQENAGTRASGMKASFQGSVGRVGRIWAWP